MPANTSDISFSIPPELDGARLDRAFATLSGQVSRSQAKEAIKAGAVNVAGRQVTDPRHPVAEGQVVCAEMVAAPPSGLVEPARMDLDIIDETEHFIVIDKPAGMVVHPAPGHRGGTLANAVSAHSEEAAQLPRAGVVHRLDKDTSGLVVVAKTQAARLSLVAQFRDRAAERSYMAIVHGAPPATGTIERPIGRNRANRLKMAVAESGRPALTRFHLVSESPGFSLLRCFLSTGRTHQIRVHLEHAGHPVAGDRRYRRHSRAEGGMFPRQMLHAQTLAFDDPGSGERISCESGLPDDFRKAMEDVGLAAD